jgi:acyl-CoA synthetase (AMP-forming)/AMP-acid ligase II
MPDFVSMVDILQQHAKNYPSQLAIKFLTQKGHETLTYHELDQKVKIMAEQLQQREHFSASRAVIILPPRFRLSHCIVGMFLRWDNCRANLSSKKKSACQPCVQGY